MSAVIRLSEQQAQKENDCSSSSSSLTPTEVPKQTTLMSFVQRLNALQKTQLTRKMQLAHFTAVNAKSFSFYEKLSQFCKDTLKVSQIF